MLRQGRCWWCSSLWPRLGFTGTKPEGAAALRQKLARGTQRRHNVGKRGLEGDSTERACVNERRSMAHDDTVARPGWVNKCLIQGRASLARIVNMQGGWK